MCLSSALLLANEIIQPILKDDNQRNDKRLGLHDADLNLINGWAFEGEKLMHGTPSGVDNAIVVYGMDNFLDPLPFVRQREKFLIYEKIHLLSVVKFFLC